MTSKRPERPAPIVSVVCLETVPDTVGLIEAMYLRQWPSWYGPGGQGDARRDLDRCLHSDPRLPRCLVAFDAKDTPVGTVSLRDSSPGSDRYVGAWLTALLVPEPFRQAGVGTVLVAAAETEAARLAFPDIFSSTASAQSLFLRRAWQRIDAFHYPSGELEIFRKDLTCEGVVNTVPS